MNEEKTTEATTKLATDYRHQNYIKNREKLLAKSRIYYENNKDKRKVYYQNNKEKRKVYANERYRKLKANKAKLAVVANGDNFLI